MTPRSSFVSAAWLGFRSLLWTMLLPGLFAGYVPWRFFGLGAVRLDPVNPVHLLGLGLITAGSVLLGMCIWQFARRGRGTLAPVDAPRELVVQGLYRYVRNPMYLSVTTNRTVSCTPGGGDTADDSPRLVCHGGYV